MDSEFNPKKYWDQRLRGNYNLIGVGDISLTMNYNKWSYKVTQSILKRLFKKYAHNDKSNKVLDFGCGTGFIVDIWRELGKDVSGIDISAFAVKKLHQKYPDFAFIEFDISEDHIPFEVNSFICCSAASVLYHIIDDKKLLNTLSNIRRMLKPEGIFIFSDNFIHNSNMNIIHQKCRSLEQYEDLLNHSGFKIIARVPNYVLFNDPVDSNGKFYPRIWSLLTRFSNKWKWFDAIIWPCLYPVELLLTAFVKESPAQEIMICKALK